MKTSGWVERIYWWWMLSTSKPRSIGGLRFLYIDAAQSSSPEAMQHVLGAALDRIRAARGGFGELVTSHLRFVATLDLPESHVLVHARGYVTPFHRLELTNPHYLACRLIWAATHIRLVRDARAYRKTVGHQAIVKACHDAQVRFTGQFEDAAEWIDYLERHPSGI